MSLDVGCGNTPRGDVNTDLYVEDCIHRFDGSLKVGNIPNFIRADGARLPFPDGMFKLVTSTHVIEHMENPVEFVKELHRVSSAYVRLVCPHRLGTGGKSPGHKWYMGTVWFQKLYSYLGYTPFTVECENRMFPFRRLGISWPYNIIITDSYKQRVLRIDNP